MINRGHSGIQVDALAEHHRLLVSELAVAKREERHRWSVEAVHFKVSITF